MWGRGKCLCLFMRLKPLEISLPLAAGSSAEASLSEQEAGSNSVSGPLDVWSVRLMDGQLVTGTSYRFLHRNRGRAILFLFPSFFFFFFLFFFRFLFFFFFFLGRGLKVGKSMKKLSKRSSTKPLEKGKIFFFNSSLALHALTVSPPVRRTFVSPKSTFTSVLQEWKAVSSVAWSTWLRLYANSLNIDRRRRRTRE